MPSGLARQIEQSFAGGMYRNGPLELIPANGVYDLQNGLLDLLGGTFRRGGSVYRSSSAFGSVGLRWVWDGWLNTGGHTTLLASTTAFGRLNSDGTITNLGEGGLAAPVRPASFEGKLYFPGGKTYDGSTWGTAKSVGAYYAIVANRLVSAEGTRVKFSTIGKPDTFEATDYHELPGGVQIIGLEGSRESAVVFTTGGIWVIGNMADNLTDAAGNVQQRLDHYSGDLVLWGNAGIAAWEGSLVVPTVDGVWLIKRGATSELVSSFERISGPIRDLYASYVRAGYQPGLASVFENHYLLPIIGNGRVVDLLVCRLDLPPARGQERGAWSRLTGFGARVAALASRVSAGTSREPELLGVTYDATARALTLPYFVQTGATRTDADGSVPEWSLQTRGYATGNGVPNLVSRTRVRYQMSDSLVSPHLRCDVASDATPAGASTWGAFVWGEGTWASPGEGAFTQLAGEAPPDLEASKPYTWNIRKKRRFVSLRFSCKDPTVQLALKTIELMVRPQGRI